MGLLNWFRIGHKHEWIEITKFYIKRDYVDEFDKKRYHKYDKKICHIRQDRCNCGKNRVVVVGHKMDEGRDEGGMGLEGINYYCTNEKCRYYKFIRASQV